MQLTDTTCPKCGHHVAEVLPAGEFAGPDLLVCQAADCHHAWDLPDVGDQAGESTAMCVTCGTRPVQPGTLAMGCSMCPVCLDPMLTRPSRPRR